MSKNKPDYACNLCCTRLEGFGVKAGNKVLLQDVNLHIHCGELTVLIGPNGAGKTTLLKAILGEIPHSGTLTYLDARGLRSGLPWIGYVPQRLDFDKSSPASVLDLCSACILGPPLLFRSRAVRKRVKVNLERFQARHLIDRRVGDLSGGELQRVLLACALDPIPDLLLLDEPVSGVDLQGMELFYNMVSDLRQRYDMSIILVSHDLQMVSRFADRLVFLNQTVLASGPPEEVLNDDRLRKVFGPLHQLGWAEQAAMRINHHPEV